MGQVKHDPLNGPPKQKGTTQNNHDRVRLLPARCFIVLLIPMAFDIACHGQYDVANSQPVAKYEPCPTL